MCGITGFAGAGSFNDLKNMSAVLVHRGPDAKGTWHNQENRVYLAHRRLSIIDLQDGAQPMLTDDGKLCVIFNGEIYNHLELRKHLISRGHVFKTDHSDTEILLHGYREWKQDLPNHLNGMWSFSIYDRSNNILFFSRDRFGKKPLYYTHTKNTFAFSSELNSLLKHPSVNAEINEQGLIKYYAYGFIPSPNSICKNIYKLPAAHNMLFDIERQTVRTYQYWELTLEDRQDSYLANENLLIEELQEHLSQAVRRRMVADVPTGVFLSGGIDSSTVAAYAMTSGSNHLNTFSISFDEDSFDESAYAKTVAAQIGSRHRVKNLSMEQALQIMPDLISKLDEPLADSSLIPTYLLCKFAKQHVGVALGGDGADELLAGYSPFRALRYANIYSKIIPKNLHGALIHLAGLLPISHQYMSLDFKIKRTLRGLSYPEHLWNPVWLSPLAPEELKDIFSCNIDPEEVYEEAINIWDRCPGNNLIDKTTSFYANIYLPDNILTKVDRASMLSSLEVRSPFLDIDLVNFLRTLPSIYRLNGGTTKYLLRKAMASILPGKVVSRSKQGFAVPIGTWFQNGDIKINQSRHINGLNNIAINNMYMSHKNNQEDNRLFLWSHWLLQHHPLFK